MPGGTFKMQQYVDLKHYQQTNTAELENTRVWPTNVFLVQYFNQYMWDGMKKEILKRVNINVSTGTSWIFKRFQKLQVIVTDRKSFKNVMSGSCFFQSVVKNMEFIDFEATEESTKINNRHFQTVMKGLLMTRWTISIQNNQRKMEVSTDN